MFVGELLMSWNEVLQPAEFIFEIEGFLQIWGPFPPVPQQKAAPAGAATSAEAAATGVETLS
jgi:hypothetical protein